MRKTNPIATIIRTHSNAMALKQNTAGAIAALTKGVLGTFVCVPEFASHIFSVAQLETAAERHELQQKWTKDSPELAAFRERIAGYGKALTELLALKEQWRQSSGLDGLAQTQGAAIFNERKAWKELVARLKAGRDMPAIAKYLGRVGTQIAPDQLQAAFRALANGRRK